MWSIVLFTHFCLTRVSARCLIFGWIPRSDFTVSVHTRQLHICCAVNQPLTLQSVYVYLQVLPLCSLACCLTLSVSCAIVQSSISHAVAAGNIHAVCVMSVPIVSSFMPDPTSVDHAFGCFVVFVSLRTLNQSPSAFGSRLDSCEQPVKR